MKISSTAGTCFQPKQLILLLHVLPSLFVFAGCGKSSQNPQFIECMPPLRDPDSFNPRLTTLKGGLHINADLSLMSTFGSLGIILHDKNSGQPLLLTNYHVTCDSEKPCPADPPNYPIEWGSTHDPLRKIGRTLRTGHGLYGSDADWALIDIEQPGWSYDGNILGIENQLGSDGSNGFNGTISPVEGMMVWMKDNASLGCGENDDPACVRVGRITQVPSLAGPHSFDIADMTTGGEFGIDGNSGSVVVDMASHRIVGLYYGTRANPSMPSKRIGNAVAISYLESLPAFNARYYDPRQYPVALFRYEDAAPNPSGNSLFTADWMEFRERAEFYGREKKFSRREGGIYRQKQDGTVPLYRYYNTQHDDSLYTIQRNEVTAMPDSPWCYAGIAGYVPQDPGPDTSQLHRYRNEDGTRHLYTTQRSEVDLKRWTPEADDLFSGIAPIYLFSEDGIPDPRRYAGMPTTRIAIDPTCSTIGTTMDGQTATTAASGTIDVIFDSPCTDATCSFTIDTLRFELADYVIAGHKIQQASLISQHSSEGLWQSDGTFALPDLAASMRYLDSGTPAALALTNRAQPIQGTLHPDDLRFTISGDIADANTSLKINLCGRITARPPVAALSPLGPFQCDSPDGGHVNLSAASSSDPDDDIRYQVWSIDGTAAGDDSVNLSTVLSLGSHAISVTAIDSRWASSTASATVSVIDSTPPSITLNLPNPCLLPVTHRYNLYRPGFEFAAQATDACDAQPQLRIIDVTSNQPPLGGSGAPLDFRFGSGAFCIRAERDESLATPREYTITLEATDASSNKTRQQMVITVPATGMDGGSQCRANLQQIVSDDDPRCVQSAP